MTTRTTYKQWLINIEAELKNRLYDVNKKIEELVLSKREIVGYKNAIDDAKKTYEKFLIMEDCKDEHTLNNEEIQTRTLVDEVHIS